MVKYIRAEDVAYDDTMLDLGGRVILPNAVLSAHIQSRTSAELLGMGVLLGGCLWVIFTQLLAVGALSILVLAGLILVAGIYREINRRFVLALNIYQIGLFEVRGLTQDEARHMDMILNDLRNTTKPLSSGAAGSVN